MDERAFAILSMIVKRNFLPQEKMTYASFSGESPWRVVNGISLVDGRKKPRGANERFSNLRADLESHGFVRIRVADE